MKRIISLVAVAAMLACWAAAGAQAQQNTTDQDEILSAVQKKYAGMETLRADYTRVTTTPAMDGVFQSTSQHAASGLLMFKKPTKLILNQATPRPEQFVTDGATVWWFIPEENVVHRYQNVDVYGELKPLLDFFAGLGGLEGSFAVKVTPAGENGEADHRLDLTRLKSDGAGPREITVWVDPENFDMKGFSLTALTGESTIFTLTNLELNPGLDDSIFIFRIPKGVEVINDGGTM